MPGTGATHYDQLTENAQEMELLRRMPSEKKVLQVETEHAESDEQLLQLSYDAYDAVLAAAFGGIRITFPSGANGERQFMRLHPGVIFIFCIALFAVQLSCLSCLVLDMDMGNIWEHQSWEGYDESPERQMKMVIRTIMTFVLQMIGLKELIGAMRPICFILNPITWSEIERPPQKGRGGFLFHAGFCMPICLASQTMKLLIGYYTLTVSMSVILLAHDVKEIIFNALVVTFLADLDEYAWTALALVFHMDSDAFEEFHFKLITESSRRGDSAARDGSRIRTPRDEQELLPTQSTDSATKEWGSLNWLRHGRGGKASVLQCLVVFFILTLVYVRQLFIFVQAVDTGILPGARDVCSWYRGFKEPQNYWLAALELKFVDFFTLINYEATLESSLKLEHIREECFSPAYIAGPFDDALKFIHWWPKQMTLMVSAIVFLFAVPQVVYANFQKITDVLNDAGK